MSMPGLPVLTNSSLLQVFLLFTFEVWIRNGIRGGTIESLAFLATDGITGTCSTTHYCRLPTYVPHRDGCGLMVETSLSGKQAPFFESPGGVS
jgi:hypothetical protein